MGSDEYEPKRTCVYCERDATHRTKEYVRNTYLCEQHARGAIADGFAVEEIKEEIKRR